MGKNVPLGRVGEAEEVGDVMCFIASSKASYITGTAINVDGGTVACEAAGLPVVRGRKTISLERQVRIAAGLLVFSGVLLASFGGTTDVKCFGLCLAGFIGAGLVFAGTTDTCGMGMVIAKMLPNCRVFRTP